MSSLKVAVVTGANKGIGYAIVKRLCKEFPGTVILTARDEQRGLDAVNSLSKEGCTAKFHQLDILSQESIQKLKKFLEEQYGGLDILVNNAGIAYKMSSTAPFKEQAEVTLRTNFQGTLDVCHALFPLLKPHARVVNVSSMASRLAQVSEEWQKKFRSTTLTEEELVSLMDQFVRDVKDGVHKSKGWSNSAYGTSKIGVTALSKIQARAFSQDSREDILINACCPGWVRTDMAGSKAPKSPDEGAETPVYLALLPPNAGSPHGEFVSDKTVQQW
ncbi:carbonyl reductase [NADPH] 1-like [Acropora muricata]|uniref:carbonyl reductase [NADPH] 1-like n=1 Tax=Acropora millepora TaxID=45264 RepID=UPI0010FC906C|nr:carbonyl reductase [NADPH] 1-like [Acropora millepora]